MLAEDTFLLETSSPFDPIFKSLPSPTLLDSTDIIADLTTLTEITNFLLNPSESNMIRIDTEYTSPTALVIFHRWLPRILYGPGEPHRGWVQSYTIRVTARAKSCEGCKGGTTQVVRYEMGGMGLLVRYPVAARLGPGGFGSGFGDVRMKKGLDGNQTDNKDEVNSDTESDLALNSAIQSESQGVEVDTPATTPDTEQDHTFIKPIQTQAQAHAPISLPRVNPVSSSSDRARFVMIKVYTLKRALDINDVYLRLVYTQIQNCLIAPHIKGRFNGPHEDFTPSLLQADDGFFDIVKERFGPAIMAASGVLRDIISVTRQKGKGLSFIGNEDGTWTVYEPKTGYGEKPAGHVKLGGKGLEMMRGAARECIRGDDMRRD
jgi:hypothetical protein